MEKIQDSRGYKTNIEGENEVNRSMGFSFHLKTPRPFDRSYPFSPF